MSGKLNINYRPCPHCTMPLKTAVVREGSTKMSITFCGNKNCSYLREHGTQYRRARKSKVKGM